MRRIFSILLLITFLLTACTSTTSTYIGKSDSWDVSLKVNNYKLIAELHYVGSHIEGLVGTNIKYKMQFKSNWSAEGSQVLPENGIIKIVCDGAGCINLNNKTEITVEWDGKQEVIVVEKMHE